MADEALSSLPSHAFDCHKNDSSKQFNNSLNSIQQQHFKIGPSLSLYERERNSLGAMGAAQWMGQFQTRPHSLLDVRNMTSIQDWEQTLPRGARRTLKKIDFSQNTNINTTTNTTTTTTTTTTTFTNTSIITSKVLPILGRQPAPHSTYGHFRCVVEHELRLLTYNEWDTNGFLNGIVEGISRYLGTTRMTGSIREYVISHNDHDRKHDHDDNSSNSLNNSSNLNILAFAHIVGKGRTLRGQWYYGTDEASKCYIWFRSVRDLVEQAIHDPNVDVVDLGPSGSDAFEELKAKYGFQLVEDWPSIANYQGDFIYNDGRSQQESNIIIDDDNDQTYRKLLEFLGLS